MVLGNTKPRNIEEEMKSSYLDYAMSVIVSRALPDVRDGLKPVHRRILYAMNELGMKHNTSYKKSARIVGEVLGKYHPHGDSSVYNSMVRMAQDFSSRYMMVDGQGNFGSIDDDPPAAMRYTEARLTKIAEQMLIDIDKETVDFMPNFDASLEEPTVLPTRLPNLLINGSSGIAVGMATNIPPHNLTEVCSGIIHLIDNPDASVDDLMQFVKGPDMPTGGIILGRDGIKSAYATGHGKIVVRARAYTSEATETTRRQIVITELPYMTNKAALVSRIADLVKDKKVTGISELRDESDRQGMRVVIELKREAQPQKVLNSLYKYTSMQTAFFANMLALIDGQPRVLSLKEALQQFIDFRRVIITRRTKYELKIAKARAHILEGLKIALDNIDRVIQIVRREDKPLEKLMEEFSLTRIQAQAILDMQLKRLSKLEVSKVMEEYAELLKKISYLEDLLANKKSILGIVKTETEEVRDSYGDERRTEIMEQGIIEFSEEDLIPHQDMVVTLSKRGFIKRVPSQIYRVQHRGGKGVIGMVTREEDAVRLLAFADTHDTLLFFTSKGKIFSTKCYELPEDRSRVGKGMAAVNVFPIAQDERITAMVALKEFKHEHYMLMATAKGEIKKVALDEFSAIRSSGLMAMDLAEGDELISARYATDENDVIIFTRNGQSITFPVSNVRASLRASGGVRAIKLVSSDKAVGMGVMLKGDYVFVITENGYGKLTKEEEYPRQKRAGSGVRTFSVVPKTGNVVDGRVVKDSYQLMIISAEGIVTRTPVKEKDPTKGITVQGRSTQGVRVMRLEDSDRVVAITCFD